ncbi:MAG: hypothetical protein HRF51_01140 [bacterium]|jgi:uncharacterized protein involved in exopolysaccharide biosynthesis
MENDKTKKSLDLSDIFAIAWKRKWLIFIPLVLVAISAYAGSYLITPEYQSSVIIWFGNPVQMTDQLRRMVGDATDVLGSERHRSEELKSMQNEVTSSPFLRQLVQNLRLDQDPSLDKKVAKMRASRPDMSPEQIKFEILADELRERIFVSFAGWEQVRISVLSTSPRLARDMAQNLGEILMTEKRRQQLGSVRLSQDFTYDQLSKYEKDLQDKIDELTEFQKKFMGYQLNEMVVSDSNRKAITSEIEGTNIEIEEKKDEERRLLAKLVDIPATKLTLEESNNLKRIKTEIQNLLVSVANLMPKYRWSDPEILNFKTKLYSYIGTLEDEHRELVEQQFASYDKATRDNIARLFNVRADLDVLYSKSNNLKLALADLTDKINSIPAYQAKLDQLNREINAARELRDRFKEQQESSQISQALLQEAQFKVVEPAKVPLSPVKPDRLKILIMGIFVGLALGGGAALLAELLDNSLKSIEQVEEFVGYPVLGVIPEINSIKNAAKVKA